MFNVGQRVRCISPPLDTTYLIKGGEYVVVKRVNGTMIKVIDETGEHSTWFDSRFELAVDLTPFEQDVQTWITTEMEALRG